jgi:organic hydroperoxide reductase OsmC/OhrA
VTRDATIRWLGHPPGGEPHLITGSHSLTPAPPLNVDLEVTNPLATSPVELLAGAIGSVFARFLAEQLVREGTQAHELVARISMTLSGDVDDDTDMMVRAVACQLWARIEGVEEEHLLAVARTAMSHCMDMLGMRVDDIVVTVDASLQGG